MSKTLCAACGRRWRLYRGWFGRDYFYTHGGRTTAVCPGSDRTPRAVEKDEAKVRARGGKGST